MHVFELQNSITENGCTCINIYIGFHIEPINLRPSLDGCYVIYYLSSQTF